MYLSILPVALFLSGFARFVKDRIRFIVVFLILQIMGLVLALDSSMTDYSSYSEHFTKVPNISEILTDPKSFSRAYGEPAFVGLQVLAKSLGLDYVIFRVIFYSLMMAFNAIFFLKFKSYFVFIFFWYFAFFYHNDGNIMRTAFSSTLFMLGVFHLGHKKTYVSLAYFIAASLFHYTAIIFIGVYVAFFLNFGRWFVIFSLLLSLMFGFFGVGRSLLVWITSYSELSFIIFDKIYRYANYNLSPEAGVVRFITVVPMALILLVFVKYNLVIRNRLDRQWLVVFSLSVCFLFIFSDFRLFADRIFTLMGMAGGALLVASFKAFNSRSLLAYQLSWLILLLIFSVYKYFNYNWVLVSLS
ncbi:EpsG family protein [Salinispirillum sp. LH 10-3-1]|uniref:EpsG family protein n=1 Tax=Salinispirillum sp. LH 10-3-1 TaxID=2952525 RepID=A0AB38YJI5_9GAMM